MKKKEKPQDMFVNDADASYTIPEEAKKFELTKQQFKPFKAAWKLKQKAIEKEIVATAKKELLTDDAQRLELLKAESQKLTDQL